MNPIARHRHLPLALLLAMPLVAWAQNAPSAGAPQAAPAGGRAQLPPPSPEQLATAQAVSQAIAQVAAQVGPSVVRIVTRSDGRRARPGRDRSGGGEDDEGPLERFFGRRRRAPERPRIGMGSGVVIDGRGFILTNNHVVEDAVGVKVTFVDGSTVNARVVGTDPKSDLAVVKVDGVQVHAARFGNSDRMKAGETVIAIGNPFGLDHSVTVGVLSAKNRAGFESGQYEDFLQTDASINPGNSGGPLINLKGEIVGINTMIVGVGTGVGFAVASSMAQPIAQQLIERGHVVRPYIGIVMQSMTPELQRSLGKGAPERGALISQVQPDSPASRAGLRPGDVIVAIDGKPAEDSHDVQRLVLQKQVGASIALTLRRDGKDRQVTLKTVQLPGAQASAEREKVGGQEGGHAQIGLALETLTPQIGRRLGFERSVRGALVVGVREGSIAAEAGVRPGDAIMEIDRRPIKSAEEAARLLSAPREQGHLLRVRRGDAALYLVLPSE